MTDASVSWLQELFAWFIPGDRSFCAGGTAHFVRRSIGLAATGRDHRTVPSGDCQGTGGASWCEQESGGADLADGPRAERPL